MAKVAASLGSLGSATHQIAGGGGEAGIASAAAAAASLNVGPMVIRKTPSELRGEQLKRTNVIELVDESPVPLGSKNTSSDVDNGFRKLDSRTPRYIDTRMDEVYAVKKSRLRMLSVKDNTKENTSTEQPNTLKNISMLSTLAAKRRRLSCPDGSVTSAEVPKDDMAQPHQTLEKCSESIFRSVKELSSSGERSSGWAVVDMDKALKGLVAHECPGTSGLTAESSENSGNHLGNFCSECRVPGQKAPLDFTLKTRMRVASSCSVNWIHSSIMSSTYNGLPQFASQCSGSRDDFSSGQALSSQILSPEALHSWVYPQSTLPSSVISVLTSSAIDGDFLRKRQLAWEDSFRSLYYMLRKNICDVFYVCTSQFVAMFVGTDGSGRTKRLCDAYISQSTRGLRSLLREHDVSFSMPLCHSKVEQVTTEDLVELSEIEKQNLGQTRRLRSISDVDNSPQSLLAFSGNKNAHGLYDFLLNYRSLLTFLSGVDVPVLYSPVPFQNAALSAPEIKCVEVRRADRKAASPKESTVKECESTQGSFSGLLSSIEIKDTYIPSWIVCRVCALMGSEAKNFEASFITERTSIGLNVALETACVGESLQESCHAFGIAEATLTPCLRSGFLKGLKYRDGSYTASLSPT